MQKRIVSIILCLCMVMGILLVWETKADDTEVNDLEATDYATVNDVETTDTTESEDPPKTVNALKMPLMDGTVLLATVEKYYSDNHKFIIEQYEFDSEGHMLRQFDRVNDVFYEYEYNAHGSLLKKICYEWGFSEGNWELSYWVEYSYEENKAGILINRTEQKYNADGSLRREAVYDSEDRLLKEIEYSKYVKDVLSSEYEYDSAENQSWRTFYDEQGNIESRYRRMYDSAGNETLYAEYDAEGNINVYEGYECDTYVYNYPYWTFENIYDEYGNIIRQIQYDEEDKEIGYTEYVYDESGNLIKKTRYDDGDNEIELDEYTYDEQKNLVSEFSSDEWQLQKDEYEYDNAGNCTKLLVTQYEYNDTGNLTTSGASSLVWERKYDEKNRVIRFQNYWDSPSCWYEYTYSTFGIYDEDYPYDKIKIKQFY